MLKNMLQPVAAIVAISLMAMRAGAADTADAGLAKDSAQSADSAATNRHLATEANTAAAEDAIEAVLMANRLHLDIRLNGRTSGRTSEDSVGGR